MKPAAITVAVLLGVGVVYLLTRAAGMRYPWDATPTVPTARQGQDSSAFPTLSDAPAHWDGIGAGSGISVGYAPDATLRSGGSGGNSIAVAAGYYT